MQDKETMAESGPGDEKEPMIKPSHKGRFTDWAKAHGFKSVQEAAAHVMANKSAYPAHVVQMANFAHNAAGFNHLPAMSKLMGR